MFFCNFKVLPKAEAVLSKVISALVGWWNVNLNKSWRGEIELTLGNKSK
jgi:hypothetical protein